MARSDPFPAVVLAVMALGLALGPQLPGLLGFPEAIWGRAASLVAASLPLVLLMLPWKPSRTFQVSALLVGVIAGVSLGVQWYTSVAPMQDEVVYAKSIYVGAYIALQALLVHAWLGEAQRQQLRGIDAQTPYTAL